LNEQRVLAASIRRLHDHLARHLPFSWRIVIANNASTDATAHVAAVLAADLPAVTVLDLGQKGRGRYAEAHGGGTVAVASQTGAAGAILTASADVAGLGGFSGRESAVSVSWLADAGASGKVRWVLAGSAAGGMPQDGRTGASAVLATVQQVGTPVGSVSGLYDLQGKAAALRASAA
jgi:hypothetical protein